MSLLCNNKLACFNMQSLFRSRIKTVRNYKIVEIASIFTAFYVLRKSDQRVGPFPSSRMFSGNNQPRYKAQWPHPLMYIIRRFYCLLPEDAHEKKSFFLQFVRSVPFKLHFSELKNDQQSNLLYVLFSGAQQIILTHRYQILAQQKQ